MITLATTRVATSKYRCNLKLKRQQQHVQSQVANKQPSNIACTNININSRTQHFQSKFVARTFAHHIRRGSICNITSGRSTTIWSFGTGSKVPFLLILRAWSEQCSVSFRKGLLLECVAVCSACAHLRVSGRGPGCHRACECCVGVCIVRLLCKAMWVVGRVSHSNGKMHRKFQGAKHRQCGLGASSMHS